MVRFFFAAIAKVNDSCRSEIGSKKQPICTNESPFAIDDRALTNSLVWPKSVPCDLNLAVDLNSLAARRK